MSRVNESHCLHLRHKGMYVLSSDEGRSVVDEGYDATAYWCTKTQKPLGPDGHPVRPDHCADGRECCEH